MDIAASYNTLNGTDAQTRQTVDVIDLLAPGCIFDGAVDAVPSVDHYPFLDTASQSQLRQVVSFPLDAFVFRTVHTWNVAGLVFRLVFVYTDGSETSRSSHQDCLFFTVQFTAEEHWMLFDTQVHLDTVDNVRRSIRLAHIGCPGCPSMAVYTIKSIWWRMTGHTALHFVHTIRATTVTLRQAVMPIPQAPHTLPLPQFSSPRVDVLLPTEILYRFADYLDPATMKLMFQNCGRHISASSMVNRVLSTRVRQLLLPFFFGDMDVVSRFCGILELDGGAICGDAVLSVIYPDAAINLNKLDLVASAARIGDYLHLFRLAGFEVSKAWNDVHNRQIGMVKMVRGDFSIRTGIQLREDGVPLSIVYDFHSSIIQNILLPRSLVVLYPEVTFARRNVVNRGRRDDVGRDFLREGGPVERYSNLGFPPLTIGSRFLPLTKLWSFTRRAKSQSLWTEEMQFACDWGF